MLPIALINANKGIMGVNLGRMWKDPELAASWLHEIVALAGEGSVDPLIHEVVPYDEAARAHQLIHDRKNIGKVLLDFRDS